jgi:hypothetical protein
MTPDELRDAMSESREAILVAQSITRNFQESGMSPATAILALLNATTAYISTCADPDGACTSYTQILKENLAIWRKMPGMVIGGKTVGKPDA